MKGNILVKGLALVVCLLMLSVANVMAQPCEGNFDCDQDVDGTDASVFKEDFGRSQFSDPCDTCIDSPCPCNTTSTTTTTACPTFDLCSQPDDCLVGKCCCTDGDNYVCDDEVNCLNWGSCVTTTTTTPTFQCPYSTYSCQEAYSCCCYCGYCGDIPCPDQDVHCVSSSNSLDECNAACASSGMPVIIMEGECTEE